MKITNKPDPELWKHKDHRARADKLIANGEPISVHFDYMYISGNLWYAPVWFGDKYVWMIVWDNYDHYNRLETYDGRKLQWVQDWRRRTA